MPCATTGFGAIALVMRRRRVFNMTSSSSSSTMRLASVRNVSLVIDRRSSRSPRRCALYGYQFGVRLQGEVKAQRFVHLSHDLGRDEADASSDALDRN